MADQKIELEIVLDDGTIKKAFGTIKDEAEKAGKETKESFAFNPIKLLGIEAGLEIFDRLSEKVKHVGEKMIELSLEAEKVRVTQLQFKNITEQTGLATEQFEESIRKSVDGLIDDDAALQLANEAMIRLGASAQRLPEIIELSRKAAASGFGDMKSNIDAFTTAIQTGNMRSLKQQLGVIADVEKAQTKYALSIGLTNAQLTESQTAFVNTGAILDSAQKKFGNVDGTVRGFSDSLTRLKVAITEAGERGAINFDKIFGGAIKGIIDTTTEAINGNGAELKANKISHENLAGAVAMLESKITSLNEKLLNARTDTQFNVYTRQIRQASEELEALKKREAEFNSPEHQKKLAEAQIQNQNATTAALALNEKQKQEAYLNTLQQQQQVEQARQGFEQQEIAARQQRTQFMMDEDAKQVELKAIHEQQLVLIAEEGNRARQNIDVQFSNEKEFNEETRQMLELERVESTNQKLLASEEAYQQASMNGFEKWAIANRATMQKVADAARITLATGVGNAFVAMGGAIARGEDGLAAFGKAFIGTLGDIAIQTGNMFIALAFANSAIPVFGLSGFGAFAAGAALLTLGGVLKAVAGASTASTSAGSPGAGGGGVGATGFDNNFNPANPVTDQRVAPNTVVNFTVQGDILDSDRTQDRIVELINGAIDTKGAVIRGM